MLTLVSNFPKKQFEGAIYEFGHLSAMQIHLPLDAQAAHHIDLHVTFGCHCFTEKFDTTVHLEHHRYVYKREVRAFDRGRYACSLQLPAVVQAMLKGRVYHADESYTYVAQITLEDLAGPQSYSVFFALEKDTGVQVPAVRMFVKSAYLKPLVAKPNGQSWRFVSLAGQIAGAFPPKEKKPRPQKKKAP